MATELWLPRVARKPMARYHGGWFTPLFVVMHHTGGSFPFDLQCLMGQTRREVSAHFYVRANGDAFQLLPANIVGYHAGESSWTHEGKLFRGLNRYAIGIELENLDGNIHPYKAPQLGSLLDGIVPAIVKALPILGDPARWVGHEQIAPKRKIDPGVLFPWKDLRQAVKAAAKG